MHMHKSNKRARWRRHPVVLRPQQKLLECQAIDQARQFVVLVLKLTIMADKVEDWLEAYSETQVGGSPGSVRLRACGPFVFGERKQSARRIARRSVPPPQRVFSATVMPESLSGFRPANQALSL